jgi:hypothetical protein
MSSRAILTYDFAQDLFFDKRQSEKCVLRGSNLNRKEGRQNEKSDSSNFAELGSLVRMND